MTRPRDEERLRALTGVQRSVARSIWRATIRNVPAEEVIGWFPGRRGLARHVIAGRIAPGPHLLAQMPLSVVQRYLEQLRTALSRRR